jgi:large subunit ribosomal protein L23
MESTRVIRKPIITEKSTYETGAHNRYTFEIDRKATKPDVRSAIEDLYKVRVEKVAIQNRKGQMRRSRFGYWRTKAQKRAVVTVHADDRIDLF